MDTVLIDSARQHLRRLLPPDRGLLLAVSGGSDSMALLHLAAALREELGLRLTVGFVDHGLRDGVDREFALVAAAASRLEVPVMREAIPKDEARAAAAAGSIQAWARERRYAILSAMAGANGYSSVATGHTLDDQAETVMLRLLRGTGLDGLKGVMTSRPLTDGVVLIRPLLAAGRAALRDYLAKEGVKYADDPSNDNHRFLRVRVRKELLPMMERLQPGVSQRLAAVAADAEAVVSYVDECCPVSDSAFERLRLGQGIRVARTVFEELPRGMWGRMVRRAFRTVRGDLRRLERCHVLSIEEHIAQGATTGALALPGEIEAHLFEGELFLFKSPLANRPDGAGQAVQEEAGLWRVRFTALGAEAEVRTDDDSLVSGVEVRSRRPGDRLFGSARRFKDVLIRSKVPRPYRDFVPVLVEANQVISCPEVLPSRNEGLQVRWVLDDAAPFLDVDVLRCRF